jgi:hypothetical protein
MVSEDEAIELDNQFEKIAKGLLEPAPQCLTDSDALELKTSLHAARSSKILSKVIRACSAYFFSSTHSPLFEDAQHTVFLGHRIASR